MLILEDLSDDNLSELLSAVSQKHYQTSLLHAASVIQEYAVVASMLRSRSNVMVLFPEISQARTVLSGGQG